jgi:hypothetical protein
LARWNSNSPTEQKNLQPKGEIKMETVKKVIDQIGICQILKHTHDSDVFYYTVEISGVQIYLCSCLENCYTHASGVHSHNPISQRVEAHRHLQQQKGAA